MNGGAAVNDILINREELLLQLEKDLENYPAALQAKHISKYLGIGIGTIYKVMDSGDIPVVRIPGSKFILVPKKLFIEWYIASLGQSI